MNFRGTLLALIILSIAPVIAAAQAVIQSVSPSQGPIAGGTQVTLIPAYTDAFEAGSYGTIWFTRDKKGGATAMHLGAGRVWDLVFVRR